ncbi:WD40 repeat-like protein [Gymnopus androsaceus JB14]|uniref:WD40 repeat-like protein n=1 Tax=Gymnopus androsaceus JB14 TaxID=1447944 RepID=A0A6A4GJ76_9AGAR|nr:WD40 repeat-like protein [Gymnopus androsaceus JB14]
MNVISTICILQKPLTIEALTKFTNNNASDVVKSLNAVLYIDSEKKIRCHLSFQEFILDKEWPKRRTGKGPYQFYLNVEKSHEDLVFICLRFMEKQLKFNICHLESSYIANEAVENPDMMERAQSEISEELRYSCESWVYHACAAEENSKCWVNITSFLKSTSMVYWMECLSCLNETSQIRTSMDYLTKRTKISEIMRGSEDISKFIRAFFLPISHSTPHLYVSALPMIPKKTWLAAHIRAHLKEVVKMSCNEYWKGEIYEINVGAEVDCVAYSPDGKQIVSGSRDNKLKIWSTETSLPIGEALEGHTDFVTCVAYSPDGTQIVSGSKDKTVRIWSAGTGLLLGEPLQGHTDCVDSVVYSPDGRQVVSGSSDCTVRIWSTETGLPVDGTQVVSVSFDNTMRMWSAVTGLPIGEPLKGHASWVSSVAHSPDGKQIATGSNDNTVRIWSAETSLPICEPMQGHTHWITSVAYSPDGTQVVSGSRDNTVRIWSVETGLSIGEPLKGHVNQVNSVAYSPDGKHIASSSTDHTIRIW